MRPVLGKLVVAIMLMLCVGIHVLEASGRWDRTIQDANDEAAIVAVVLCIGAALSVVATVLRHLRARPLGRTLVLRPLTPIGLVGVRLSQPSFSPSPPPIPLRV